MHLLRVFLLKSSQLQEDKSSAARKLIQPDLVAMSQLLNFDEEVRKKRDDSETERFSKSLPRRKMPLKAKRRRCRRWWRRRGRGAGWGRRAPSTSPWRRSGTSGPPSPGPSWRWDLFLGLENMLPCFLPTRVYLHQYLKADSASRA